MSRSPRMPATWIFHVTSRCPFSSSSRWRSRADRWVIEMSRRTSDGPTGEELLAGGRSSMTWMSLEGNRHTLIYDRFLISFFNLTKALLRYNICFHAEFSIHSVLPLETTGLPFLRGQKVGKSRKDFYLGSP